MLIHYKCVGVLIGNNVFITSTFVLAPYLTINCQILSCRIIGINEDGTFKTKGDANNVADASLVPNDNVLGKVILKIPKLGYLQDLLASKVGLILVVLIPSLAILSYDIMKVFKKLGQKTKIIKE